MCNQCNFIGQIRKFRRKWKKKRHIYTIYIYMYIYINIYTCALKTANYIDQQCFFFSSMMFLLLFPYKQYCESLLLLYFIPRSRTSPGFAGIRTKACHWTAKASLCHTICRPFQNLTLPTTELEEGALEQVQVNLVKIIWLIRNLTLKEGALLKIGSPVEVVM